MIYNYPEQLFADAKIMAIEHADFEGIERLALVLGNNVLVISTGFALLIVCATVLFQSECAVKSGFLVTPRPPALLHPKNGTKTELALSADKQY